METRDGAMRPWLDAAQAAGKDGLVYVPLEDVTGLIESVERLARALDSFVSRQAGTASMARSMLDRSSPLPPLSFEAVRQFLEISLPAPVRFLQIMLDREGRMILDEDLADLLGCKVSSLKVVISHARARLADAGFNIKILRDRGQGYRMEPAEARRIAEVCHLAALYSGTA